MLSHGGTLPAYLAFFVALVQYVALAGPPPMPLEAQLDLAECVVVGKIERIEPVKEEQDKYVHYGWAHIAVERVLKGKADKEVRAKVATWVSKDYGGCCAPPQYKAGDQGLWLVGPAASCGHLGQEHLPRVQAALKALDERRWSDPVNGLHAWACAVQAGLDGGPLVVIFALQNATGKDLCYPSETQSGLVRMTLTVERGQPRKVDLDEGRGSIRNERVHCRTLRPGDIVYAHPDYSYLRLPKDLPAGKYTALVSFQNDRPGEQEGKRVVAWQGEVKAPAVTVVIAVPEKP